MTRALVLHADPAGESFNAALHDTNRAGPAARDAFVARVGREMRAL